MNEKIIDAIKRIRPESEFSIQDGNLDKWIKDDINGLGKPTKEEIDGAIAQLEIHDAEEKQKEADRKVLLKDKNASIKDRVDALIEHFGLDI